MKEHVKKFHQAGSLRSLTTPKPPSSSRPNSGSPGKDQQGELNDYERCGFKCHECRVGFQRRGMLINHLIRKHPNVSIDSVPELREPVMRSQRDYYCQYCAKVRIPVLISSLKLLLNELALNNSQLFKYK